MRSHLFALQLPAHRHSIHLRHHYIADNKIGNDGKSLFETVETVYGGRYLGFFLQCETDIFANIGIVFHDKDAASFGGVFP